MAERVLCKFFARGECLKSQHCEFSHHWKAPAKTICTFYQKGVCAYGSSCRFEHSEVFQSSPLSFKTETTNEHIAEDVKVEHSASDESSLSGCEKRQKHLDSLRHSRDIECCVCFEQILSKSTPLERKFGILSECDHTFCVSCIRAWRGSAPSSVSNVNLASRACPMCRKVSYFIIPSTTWYFSKNEKQEIVDSYKRKLKTIDCKHFNFGTGKCPFRIHCFYRHAYR